MSMNPFEDYFRLLYWIHSWGLPQLPSTIIGTIIVGCLVYVIYKVVAAVFKVVEAIAEFFIMRILGERELEKKYGMSMEEISKRAVFEDGSEAPRPQAIEVVRSDTEFNLRRNDHGSY